MRFDICQIASGIWKSLNFFQRVIYLSNSLLKKFAVSADEINGDVHRLSEILAFSLLIHFVIHLVACDRLEEYLPISL